VRRELNSSLLITSPSIVTVELGTIPIFKTLTSIPFIDARYEKGVLKPLEPLELKEGERLAVKIVKVEERRRALRKYRRALGSVSKELLDRFMLEARL